MVKSKETPAKKYKLSDFQKQCKLYFSSLSARGNKFIYVNLPDIKNSIVVTNGDYEMLASYCPTTFSIHLIEPKNDFYEQLLSYLNIDRKYPYIFRTDTLMKAFKDVSLEDTVCQRDMEGNISIRSGESIVVPDKAEEISEDDGIEDEDNPEEVKPDKDSPDTLINLMGDSKEDIKNDALLKTMIPVTFKTSEICGTPVNNDFSLYLLLDEVVKLKRYSREYFDRENRGDKEGYVVLNLDPLNKLEYRYSNKYSTALINFGQLRNKHGEILFATDSYLSIPLLLGDGLDNPSVKEFTNSKNYKTTDKSLDIYVWTDNACTLKSVSIYEDNISYIRSTRPFFETVVLKSVFINNTKTSVTEEYSNDKTD